MRADDCCSHLFVAGEAATGVSAPPDVTAPSSSFVSMDASLKRDSIATEDRLLESGARLCGAPEVDGRKVPNVGAVVVFGGSGVVMDGASVVVNVGVEVVPAASSPIGPEFSA